jgi:hypothetical protein
MNVSIHGLISIKGGLAKESFLPAMSYYWIEETIQLKAERKLYDESSIRRN